MWGKRCINSALYRYSNESKVSSSGSYFLEYIVACGSLYEFRTRNWEVKENYVITWNTYSQHIDLFQRPQYWLALLRRAVDKDRTSVPSSSAFEWKPMVPMILFPPLCWSQQRIRAQFHCPRLQWDCGQRQKQELGVILPILPCWRAYPVRAGVKNMWTCWCCCSLDWRSLCRTIQLCAMQK